MTIKKSYVSKIQIWTKRTNFLRPAFYDDDDDDDGISFLATVFLKTIEAGWAGRGPIAPYLSISY